MLPGSARSKLAAAALLAGLAALGGCGQKIWISQYPHFHTADLKTIAVVRFANRSGYPQAGKIFTDELVAALRANGTYQVLAGKELTDLLGPDAPAVEPGAATLPVEPGRLGEVQAVLTGTVTEFGARSGFEVRRGHYGFDAGFGYYHGRRGYYGYGRRRWPYYYDSYSWNRADVAATAELIRAADRETIHATRYPVGASVHAGGDPPRWGRYDVLAEATAAAASKLVEAFAIVRRQVKVDPGKALRLARERAGGKWHFTDDFRAADSVMHVLVSLPPVADRNSFRLTVVRKGSDDLLAEEEFTWSRQRRRREFRFSPSQIAERGGGPGHYRLRLHVEGQVALRRGFEIEP